MNLLSISQEEINEINRLCSGNVDKWFRMMMGIGSKLLAVENGIIYLQVIYSQSRAYKSKAASVATVWMRHVEHPAFQNSHTLVALEYTDPGSSGCFIVLDEDDDPEEVKARIDPSEFERFGENKQLIGKKIFATADLQGKQNNRKT